MMSCARVSGFFFISLAAVCQLLGAGCATTGSAKDVAVHPCSSGAVTVEVSEDGGPMLTGVRCKIRGREADISCPTTDAIARTCLDSAVLLNTNSLAVEFCKEGYFCGAFRMAEERDLVPGLDFRLLMLAPRTDGTTPSSSFSCSNANERQIQVEDPEGTGIPGVAFYWLGREGETALAGTTNALGRYCMAEYRSISDGGALLACRNAFFCGLLPTEDLPEPGRLIVFRLARFAIS